MRNELDFQVREGEATVTAPAYRAVVDLKAGGFKQLVSGDSNVNWIASGSLDLPVAREPAVSPTRLSFGAPFVGGTQKAENPVSLQCRPLPSEGRIFSESESGSVGVETVFEPDGLRLEARLPLDAGPRSGLNLDMHFLDLPTGSPWQSQTMPVTLYTSEDFQYAYFLWQRSAEEHLVMVVDAPFAAWRIKYSYHGHHMQGFQLLNVADDVVTPVGVKLLRTSCLRVGIAFAGSWEAGLRTAVEKLGLAVATTPVSGGPEGTALPVNLIGRVQSVVIVRPSGRTEALAVSAPVARLQEPGLHEIRVTSAAGRVHVTRVLCHEDWRTLFQRVNGFYRRHFQHPCGAFFRCVSAGALAPDDVTLEGLPFGDPTVSSSCRSGEFGGFSAAAMMKGMGLFGETSELRESVDRYILNWALNRGHEETPLPGSLCKSPHTFHGVTFSAYHIYSDINYPQHEVFFLNQLVDYARLTDDSTVLADAMALGRHMIEAHVRPDGAFLNRRQPDQEGGDYTSIDMPVIALGRLGHLLESRRPEASAYFFRWARTMADHLCRRGMSFPTEGEACTEDGSMACAALSLAYSHLFLGPNPGHLAMAGVLVEAHEKLVLKSADCRLHQSSLRFWETLYETAAWGPSINAGHGWTLWTGATKALLYLATHRIHWLQEAWCASMAALCNVDANGGIHPCFTPDMIPGAPPDPWVAIPANRLVRFRQSALAMRRPDNFSASGNHQFIWAALLWGRISGVLADGRTPINAHFDAADVLVSAAPKFDRLALAAVPREPLPVRVRPGARLTVTFEDKEGGVGISGGRLVRETDHALDIEAQSDRLSIGRANG
ncbi:MAG: hypothetical protein HY343_08975 [Lentisphaerae bacterium]|nr:hypothetical protein [Lentisphaerota bacterium]